MSGRWWHAWSTPPVTFCQKKKANPSLKIKKEKIFSLIIKWRWKWNLRIQRTKLQRGQGNSWGGVLEVIRFECQKNRRVWRVSIYDGKRYKWKVPTFSSILLSFQALKKERKKKGLSFTKKKIPSIVFFYPFLESSL